MITAIALYLVALAVGLLFVFCAGKLTEKWDEDQNI